MSQDRRAPLLPGRGPLAGAPALTGFLGVVVVFAVAVIAGGLLGAVLLGLLALGVVALLSLAWPRLSPAARAVRVLALGALVAVALAQVPW